MSHSYSQLLLQVPYFHVSVVVLSLYFSLSCYIGFSPSTIIRAWRNFSTGTPVGEWSLGPFVYLISSCLFYKTGGFPVACNCPVRINNSKCTCFCDTQGLMIFFYFFTLDLPQSSLDLVHIGFLSHLFSTQILKYFSPIRINKGIFFCLALCVLFVWMNFKFSILKMKTKGLKY